MNYRMMIYMLGWVLNFEAVFMLPSLAVGLLYRETESATLDRVFLLCAFLGGLAVCRKPPAQKFYAGRIYHRSPGLVCAEYFRGASLPDFRVHPFHDRRGV